MSIVEKAVEKLKTLTVESPPSPQVETAPRRAVPTVERLQEQMHIVDQPAEAPPLCHVDLAALKRMGWLPADGEAEHRRAAELSYVKRPLLANAIGLAHAGGKDAETFIRGKRIVVTSAEAGEGKTFAAVNLAMSLARETDFEVLLVDGDVSKSDITRIFGLDGKPGLMHVLADEQRAPAEVIIRTDVPNLLVVPAGEPHPFAAELFRSRRMEYVLDEFGGRNRRRLMVFDSSPLLATTESQVLVSHMGQVVMVVAANRTRRQAVNAALQRLSAFQYVGLVLNRSRLPAGENYYGNYYERHSKDR